MLFGHCKRFNTHTFNILAVNSTGYMPPRFSIFSHDSWCPTPRSRRTFGRQATMDRIFSVLCHKSGHRLAILSSRRRHGLVPLKPACSNWTTPVTLTCHGSYTHHPVIQNFGRASWSRPEGLNSTSLLAQGAGSCLQKAEELAGSSLLQKHAGTVGEKMILSPEKIPNFRVRRRDREGTGLLGGFNLFEQYAGEFCKSSRIGLQ